MTDLIEIDKYPVRDVLSLLLKDKTTGKNIIFATDTYSEYGYAEHDYMTETAVLGFSSCDIQPRVFKTQSEQNERTRKKAEVFSPAWLCNLMIDDGDTEWFDYEKSFNCQSIRSWITKTEKIKFSDNKNWKSYIDSRRLEITCGEAPYIVSRYDATTGEIIPVNERIGILDRKLRVVSENTITEDEWMKWVVRAYQSVYGYEFQGDNLLIARINLLLSFSEYLEYNWHRKANKSELKKIANIIVWNIWQMDGLSDTVPAINFNDCVQMTFFKEELEERQEYCKIHDWRKESSFLFKELKNRKKGKNMKFDYIIGNPPYQEGDNDGFGKSAKPVYNLFIEQAKTLDPDYLSMIIPARWFAGGKGLDSFRQEMLSDSHIRRIVDFENYKDVFPNLGGLAGGACFFIRDKNYKGLCTVTNYTSCSEYTMKRKLDEYDVFIRNNKFVSIVNHIMEMNKTKKTLCDVVSARKPFGLPTNYKPREKGIPCWFIQRIGKKYADAKDVDNTKHYLDKWKLLAPKAPIAGQTDFSKQVSIYYDSNVIIAKPGECCTESFIILGAFDTEKEVISYKSYIFTKIVRFLLLQSVVSQDITRKNFCFVPDLEKYNQNFSDQYLKKLWNLNDEEWKLIDEKIK